MSNFLSKNIRYLRKSKGLTQSELADKIGVNRAVLGSYEEDRAAPKLPALQALAHYFETDLDELLDHDFSLGLPDQKKSKDIKGSGLRILSTIVDRDDHELVTVVPAKASAGYLTGYADPEYVESLPKFSVPLPEMPGDRTYRAFQIRGDSMDPVPDGAYILSEYIQDWHTIKDNQAYILVTLNEGIVYKRLYNRIEEAQEIICKSDNPAYDPFTVKIDEVIDVWKAVGYISFNLPDPNDIGIHKLSAEVSEMKKTIDELKNKA